MQGFCIIDPYLNTTVRKNMKHDMITQRLKGLIQNLSIAVNTQPVRTQHSESKFASNLYQFFIQKDDCKRWILSLTFRTESEEGSILPIEEQSVYFSLSNQTYNGEVIQAFRSCFLDVNEARSILKKTNKAINILKSDNQDLDVNVLIRLILEEMINSSPNLKENNESAFIVFADSIKEDVIQAKQNYSKAKELKTAEEEKTKSDIENSDEYKLVSTLEKQLREAQSNLRKKEHAVKEENNSLILFNNLKEASQQMNNKAESFYSSCVKKLRDLELPFSLYKKYKDISSLKDFS